MAVKPMGIADASRLVRETQARKKPLRYEDLPIDPHPFP